MDIQPVLSFSYGIGAVLEGALIGAAGFAALMAVVWLLTTFRQELRSRKALAVIIRFEDGKLGTENTEKEAPESDLKHVSTFRAEVSQLRSRPSQ